MEGSRDAVPFPSRNSIITKRTTNRVNLQPVPPILIQINWQADSTTTSDLKVTDIRGGHSIPPSSGPTGKSFWIDCQWNQNVLPAKEHVLYANRQSY